LAVDDFVARKHPETTDFNSIRLFPDVLGMVGLASLTVAPSRVNACFDPNSGAAPAVRFGKGTT
jgi:hypothetical protein